MSVAQGLYEGVKIPEKGSVGLITYMRTDSTRISEEARAIAKEQITKDYGDEYYENRYYKAKKDSQDAHEAIRPTYIDINPEEIKDALSKDQYKLYKLIYNRFMASQMSAAIYNTVSATVNVNSYNFKANGQTLKFKNTHDGIYIDLPKYAPDKYVSVIKVEFDKQLPRFKIRPMNQSNYEIVDADKESQKK